MPIAVALTAVALAMAVALPATPEVALGTSLILVLLYAAAREVGFEIGTGYTCPVILVLVPMLFRVPQTAQTLLQRRSDAES